MPGLRDAIQSARKVVDQDPNLAVFMVRDYQELTALELDDLVWAMYREYAAPSEVKWLLNEIERRLKEIGS